MITLKILNPTNLSYYWWAAIRVSGVNALPNPNEHIRLTDSFTFNISGEAEWIRVLLYSSADSSLEWKQVYDFTLVDGSTYNFNYLAGRIELADSGDSDDSGGEIRTVQLIDNKSIYLVPIIASKLEVLDTKSIILVPITSKLSILDTKVLNLAPLPIGDGDGGDGGDGDGGDGGDGAPPDEDEDGDDEETKIPWAPIALLGASVLGLLTVLRKK